MRRDCDLLLALFTIVDTVGMDDFGLIGVRLN